MTETTKDTLFGGDLTLHQPARKKGYRVNADALLLAAFARGGPRARVRRAIDLGSGVGAVGLALLHLDAVEHVTFVDVDGALVALAARNVEDNGFVHRAEIVHADVSALRGATADLVVCNPPYVEPGRGPAPDRSRRSPPPRAARSDAGRARASCTPPSRRPRSSRACAPPG